MQGKPPYTCKTKPFMVAGFERLVSSCHCCVLFVLHLMCSMLTGDSTSPVQVDRQYTVSGWCIPRKYRACYLHSIIRSGRIE